MSKNNLWLLKYLMPIYYAHYINQFNKRDKKNSVKVSSMLSDKFKRLNFINVTWNILRLLQNLVVRQTQSPVAFLLHLVAKQKLLWSRRFPAPNFYNRYSTTGARESWNYIPAYEAFPSPSCSDGARYCCTVSLASLSTDGETDG